MTCFTLGALMFRLAWAPVEGHRARLDLIAAQVLRVSAHYKLDPLLVTAVIFRESTFNPRKVGKAGELGLGQLKRHTLATHGYDDRPDAALMVVPLNLALTARHLAHVRKLCGTTDPSSWLSVYSGHRFCRPSPYSAKVVETWMQLRRWAGQGVPGRPLEVAVAR